MTTKTLWQGWWSPISLIAFTPFTLLANLRAYRKFTRLPHPVPRSGTPLAEVRPVHERPLAYVAALPALWALWYIAGGIARMITQAH
ncbi:hypothetical protein ACWCP6_28580 [Streptomyces sp. NPDC002004]